MELDFREAGEVVVSPVLYLRGVGGREGGRRVAVVGGGDGWRWWCGLTLTSCIENGCRKAGGREWRREEEEVGGYGGW